MKKLSRILFIQLLLTFLVLSIFYMAYAISDTEEVDSINMLVLLIVQPLLAMFLAILTILICTLVGLPLRLNDKFYNWWQKTPIISVTIFFCGMILLGLSFVSFFRDTTKTTIEGQETIKYIPNHIMLIIGWFIVAFSLLHFYPKQFISWLKKVL